MGLLQFIGYGFLGIVLILAAFIAFFVLGMTAAFSGSTFFGVLTWVVPIILVLAGLYFLRKLREV